MELELVGAEGPWRRVGRSTIRMGRGGEPALGLTAFERLPEARTAVVPSRPRAMMTLDAMGESVITVDAEGRIDYINHAAETLLGQRFDQVMGRSFSDVASLSDETDRRSLGDPVRKALATGGRFTTGRHAVLVPAPAGPARAFQGGSAAPGE